MNIKNYYFIIIVFSIGIASCKKDTNSTGSGSTTGSGVYIVNEGSFGNSNASISYMKMNSPAVNNNLFFNVNGYPVGDIAQSMTIYRDKNYIVVNNSQKVEVTYAEGCSGIATITGFAGPRYFKATGNKGYVSDWFDDNIKVVDLVSNTITNSIPTGSGPEQMVIYNDILFVCNVGGWGSDSTVTVIDTQTDSVLTTIHVGINPNSISVDTNGKLWVLCGGSTGPDFIGGTADDIAGSIWMIDPATFQITGSQILQQSDHPFKLTYDAINNRMMLLMGIDGYTGAINYFDNSALPVSMTIFSNKIFYGLGIDPTTSMVYAGLAPGFTQNGYMFRYESNGTLKDSLEVGIAPNGFAFKY
jgi:YVTN family beta-propeller protein